MDKEIINKYIKKSTKELKNILLKNDNTLDKETKDFIESIIKNRFTGNLNLFIVASIAVILIFGVVLLFRGCNFNSNKKPVTTNKNKYYNNNSFTHANPGEKWLIQDNNISVMKTPEAPKNKSAYMGNLLTVVGDGDIVKIIGTKGLYWKKVSVYNHDQIFATGWILSDTVGKAKKIE